MPVFAYGSEWRRLWQLVAQSFVLQVINESVSLPKLRSRQIKKPSFYL